MRIGVGLVCVAVGLLATGGCRPPGEEPLAEGQLARYRGGVVTLEDVEALLARSGATGSPAESQDALVERYRRAAESVVLEHLLVPTEASVEAMLAELGDPGRALLRRAVAAVYAAGRLGDLRVAPEEVEEFFAENPDLFRRPAQRNLWHIYRRFGDPPQPEQTAALLLELKRRAEGGEGFSQLAEEYSESETRTLGGRLGIVEQGRLPKALEDVVFALGPRGISDPVTVPGGMTLFYVSERIDERNFALEDARTAIAAHLHGVKRRARIAELVAAVEPPPGSVVLDPDQVVAALSQSHDPVVLEVDGFRLTASELRARLAEDSSAAEKLFEATGSERIAVLYQDLLHEQLLNLAAASDDLPVPQQRAIDLRSRLVLREALVRQRLEARMRARAGADDASVGRFFDDNRHLYQTPLRLKLHSLSLAPGADPAATLGRLNDIHARLAIGAIDLQAAAQQLGGRVSDLGWVGFDQLMAFEPKVRYYILGLNGTGYTEPFQLNQVLNMVWVEARDEPRELPFEQVKARVLDDFYTRNQQQLYRATVDALLDAESFRFSDDALRRVLAPPIASDFASSE